MMKSDAVDWACVAARRIARRVARVQGVTDSYYLGIDIPGSYSL